MKKITEIIGSLTLAGVLFLASCSAQNSQYTNPYRQDAILWGNSARENKKWDDALECYRRAGDVDNEETTLFEMHELGHLSQEDYFASNREIKRFTYRHELSDRFREHLKSDGARYAEHDFEKSFNYYLLAGEYEKCREVLNKEVQRHGAYKRALELLYELNKANPDKNQILENKKP